MTILALFCTPRIFFGVQKPQAPAVTASSLLKTIDTNFSMKEAMLARMNALTQGIFTGAQAYVNGIKPHVVMFDINGVLLNFDNTLIPEGVALLQKCARAGHTIMILSNCDRMTLVYMYALYYQEIFQYIKHENILVAGLTRRAKPSDGSYKLAIDTITQDPVHAAVKAPASVPEKQNIFFIDDSLSNVEAAQRHGIIGLHLDNGDYAAIERQLELLGALPRTALSASDVVQPITPKTGAARQKPARVESVKMGPDRAPSASSRPKLLAELFAEGARKAEQ